MKDNIIIGLVITFFLTFYAAIYRDYKVCKSKGGVYQSNICIKPDSLIK